MKKKVKQTPNIPFYSDEPAVSKSLIADKPAVPGNLANKPPKMVDKGPGKGSGLAGFVSKTKPIKRPSGIKSPKLGTSVSYPKQGHLRMSGNSGAHRIGAPKLPKVK